MPEHKKIFPQVVVSSYIASVGPDHKLHEQFQQVKQINGKIVENKKLLRVDGKVVKLKNRLGEPKPKKSKKSTDKKKPTDKQKKTKPKK